MLIKKQDKRGITPVVATVLLVAIVVVLGLIIYLVAINFVKEEATKFEEPISKACDSIAPNLALSYSGTILTISNNDPRVPLNKIQIVNSGEDSTPVPLAEELNILPGASKDVDVGSSDVVSIIPVLKGTLKEQTVEHVCDNEVDINS